MGSLRYWVWQASFEVKQKTELARAPPITLRAEMLSSCHDSSLGRDPPAHQTKLISKPFGATGFGGMRHYVPLTSFSAHFNNVISLFMISRMRTGCRGLCSHLASALISQAFCLPEAPDQLNKMKGDDMRSSFQICSDNMQPLGIANNSAFAMWLFFSHPSRKDSECSWWLYLDTVSLCGLCSSCGHLWFHSVVSRGMGGEERRPAN